MSEDTPEPVTSGGPSIGPAFLLIIGAALASAFVAVWGVQVIGQQREKVLSARVDSLRTVLDQARHGAVRGGEAPGNDAIGPDELDALRRAGLADPAREIAADLVRHPELIPIPAVVGGTMGFRPVVDIRLLGGHWVFARFEDGHIGGSGVFEYEVRNGRIRWKRLASAAE